MRESPLGCVCPFPTRALSAEELLTGSRREVEKACPQAADAIADAADLVDDHEGSAEYKRHLIHVFLRRAWHKVLRNSIGIAHWQADGRSISPARLNGFSQMPVRKQCLANSSGRAPAPIVSVQNSLRFSRGSPASFTYPRDWNVPIVGQNG